MNNLQTAKSYLAKGLSVMPVGRDKKPLLKSWKEYQTRLPTQEELEEWFSKPANIAIITGKISNLSVVDIDPRHGGTPKGLPPTLTAKTQSGGWHFYYRYLEGLPNKAGIREGIDIRSDGGFVVAPPSEGEKGKWVWALIEEPQPFPADILKVEIGKSSVDWQKVANGVGEGNRNETAAKFIGKLIHSFKPQEWESAVWLTVLNWNRANKPPLPESELRAIFNSITSRESKKENQDDAPVVLLSEAAKKFGDDLTASYPTGFTAIDENAKGGVREGDLVLVVGETGMGKTAFARTLTCNLLESEIKIPSIWFSFEVKVSELWELFHEEMGLEEDVPIYTPERYVSRSLKWIKEKIIEARDEFKCKVVFIDHLGYLIGEYNGRQPDSGLNLNLASVYGMICRDLKTLAIQENMVVVLLWHLRKLGKGQNEADISDIKDSSSVLQECDLGFNVSREKIKTTKKFDEEEDIGDVLGTNAFIKTLKNRRTGILKRFKCEYTKGRLVETDKVKESIKIDNDFDF